MAINEDTQITTIEKIISKADTKELKTINVKNLAQKVGSTPNKLSKEFKRKRGNDLKSLIRPHKMMKAYELIINRQDLQIKEISKIIGYEKVEYFSKIFKEYYEIAPNEIRKILLENDE